MSVSSVPVLNYSQRLTRLAGDSRFVQQNYGAIKSALAALCDKEERGLSLFEREVRVCREAIQEADHAGGTNPELNAKVVRIYAQHFRDFQSGLSLNPVPEDQTVKQAVENYGRHGTTTFYYLFDIPTQAASEHPTERALAAFAIAERILESPDPDKAAQDLQDDQSQAAKDALEALNETKKYLNVQTLHEVKSHQWGSICATRFIINRHPDSLRDLFASMDEVERRIDSPRRPQATLTMQPSLFSDDEEEMLPRPVQHERLDPRRTPTQPLDQRRTPDSPRRYELPSLDFEEVESHEQVALRSQLDQIQDSRFKQPSEAALQKPSEQAQAAFDHVERILTAEYPEKAIVPLMQDRSQAAKDAVDAIQQAKKFLKYSGLPALSKDRLSLPLIKAYLINKFPNPAVPVSPQSSPVRTSPLERRGSTEQLPPSRSMVIEDVDAQFEPTASGREKALAEQCKNPSDEFVQSVEFTDDVYPEMVELFTHGRDTPAFKKLQEELTPSVFASLRENQFAKIEDILKYQPSANSVDLPMRKMIAKAYQKYIKIKDDAAVESLQKAQKARVDETIKLLTKQYHQLEKEKAQFGGFIDHLDKLQKKGGYTDEQVQHMRNQLFLAVQDSSKAQAIAAMKKCMTTLGNDTAVVRALRLVSCLDGKNYTVPFADYSEADKQLIIRAYKIYMREKVNATYYPKPEDLAEIRTVTQLGKASRGTQPLQAKREARRTAQSRRQERLSQESRSPSPSLSEEEVDTSRLRVVPPRTQARTSESSVRQTPVSPRQEPLRSPTSAQSPVRTYRQNPRPVVSPQTQRTRYTPPKHTASTTDAPKRVVQGDRQSIPYRPGIYSSTYRGQRPTETASQTRSYGRGVTVHSATHVTLD